MESANRACSRQKSHARIAFPSFEGLSMPLCWADPSGGWRFCFWLVCSIKQPVAVETRAVKDSCLCPILREKSIKDAIDRKEVGRFQTHDTVYAAL